MMDNAASQWFMAETQPLSKEDASRRQHQRGGAALRAILWAAVGALICGLLLADPFGISPLDEWLGLRPVAEHHGETTHQDSTQQLWTCGMHPQVIQDHPGTCPICGMNLVPLKTDTADSGHDDGRRHGDSSEASHEQQLWTCSMHPQVVESHPGDCPICGMKLVPVKPDASTADREQDAGDHPEKSGQHQLWTCSMHPQVIEDHPGTCPICGMDLVPVKGSGEEPNATQHGDSRAHGGKASASGAKVTIDPAVQQNMNVTTQTVQRRNVSRRIRTVGYLDYDQEKMVSVTTKYPGFIEKASVNYVGQPVLKGEHLFDVYAPDLVQTEQELLSAERYVRQMDDAPEDARQRAQALVDAARTRLSYWDITEDQIDRLLATGTVFRTLAVVAPASGVVMKRMKGLEGMAIRPGMELMHIADLSSLWLTVEVFEDQLPWVHIGSPAQVELTYFPGESFTGHVRYIEPSVSEKTRTVQLTLDIPNPKRELRAGMYATVIFSPVAARDAIAVPSDAVIRTGERNVVILALGNGRFAPRDVVLGPVGEGWVQVVSGLSDGDTVVTSAQFLIDSESNLKQAIQKMIEAKRSQTNGGGA